jgi:hypothetical protein
MTATEKQTLLQKAKQHNSPLATGNLGCAGTGNFRLPADGTILSRISLPTGLRSRYPGLFGCFSTPNVQGYGGRYVLPISTGRTQEHCDVMSSSSVLRHGLNSFRFVAQQLQKMDSLAH